MWVNILMTVAIVLIILAVALYFLNKKASKKMAEQQEIIDTNRQVQSIFIIDKKRDKAENVNLPKVVMEQLPRLMKIRKTYFVQAKIGPQIMTFMCEKKVFEALPVKKNIKVELVGIYILGIAGGQKEKGKKTGKTDTPAAKPTLWESVKGKFGGSSKR